MLFNLDQVQSENQCQIGDDLCYNKLNARGSSITKFLDYDLDGDVDILYASSSATVTNGTKYNYTLKKYNIDAPYSVDEGTSILAWDSSSNGKARYYNNVFVDFSGDGNLDYFQLYRDGVNTKNQSFSYGKGINKPKNKITKITNNFNIIAGSQKQTHINIEYLVATDPAVYKKSTGSFALPVSGNGSPIFDIFSPSYMVSTVTKSSPVATTSMSYNYAGLKVKGGGRGSLGFASITSYDPHHNITTETQYRQDFPYIGMPDSTMTSLGDCSSNCELLSESTNTYLDKSTTLVYGSTTNEHITYYPYLWQSIEKQYSYNSSIDENSLLLVESVTASAQKTTINDFRYSASSYPDYANLTSSETRICSGLATHASCVENIDLVESKKTSNGYTDDINGWFLGRLTSSTSTNKRKVDTVFTSSSRSSSFSYDINYTNHTGTGQLIEEIINGNNSQFLRTVHQYNSSGQEYATYQCSAHTALNTIQKCVATAVVARPSDPTYIHRYTKTFYDSSWPEFVNSTSSPFTSYDSYVFPTNTGINMINHLDEGSTLEVVSSTVDSRDIYGNPTSAYDMFGNEVATAYGAFGDAHATGTSLGGYSKTTKAWCTKTTESTFPYCPSSASSVVTTTQANGTTSKKFIDIMGRQVRSQNSDFNGHWTTIDTFYNDLGLTIRQTEPYTRNRTTNSVSSNNEHETTSRYDAMDRVLEIITPTHCEEVASSSDVCINQPAITTTSYQNLAVATTNPMDQTTTQYFDVTGKVTSSVDSIGGSVSYKYDTNGNLSKTTDAISAISTLTYDAFGRKTKMVDADKGTWNYQYNAVGQLISQDRGGQSATKSYYDVRGRMFYRYNSDENSIWEYDKGSNYGLLINEYSISNYATSNIAQIKNYIYDIYHRPSETEITIYDGQSTGSQHNYTTKVTYDGLGRVFQTFDATGNVILFQYNTNGFQHITRDGADLLVGQIYHEVINTDSRGNVINERFNDTFNTTRYVSVNQTTLYNSV